ncbi:MAG: heparin lyase I family protein [Pirellulaceae bacterium]
MRASLELALLCIAAVELIRLPGQVAAQWIEQLPRTVRDSILWSADHEEGALDDWTAPGSRMPGGGVLNTGEPDASAQATTEVTHSGRYAAAAFIRGAKRGREGPRAVRLMRWTDKPWDQGGASFPTEAYYSTWAYFPRTFNPNKYAPWDPGDGGWWIVFQFKAHDDQDVSQPVWALNVFHDDRTKRMHFYLFSPANGSRSVEQSVPRPIPVRQWVHLEAYYRVSAAKEGAITVWQDGHRILHAHGVRTAVSSQREQAVWGIGSYTDHIAGDTEIGTATVYFDDAVVSTRRVSETLPDGR